MSTVAVPLHRPLAFEPLRVPGERPAFRGDIEGLRGIAVLLVVLYHAGVPGFSGGYVGVDVFFALSGYLITGILASEVERTGRVDLARFYARRARRLLPASAVLLLTVTAFAYVFYSPVEQEGIARTALATAAYVSNLHFASGATDYLGAAAETNPLLHTWSLAVEEQFYLGWPLLVVVGLVGLPWIRRGRLALSHRRLAWAMAGVSVVTFALTVYLMGTTLTPWAFFASPARAWEFALGGLGAVLPRVRLTRERGPGGATGAHVLGWLGLAGVIAAGSVYTARTPFPGWTALVPVAGTVLALRAGVGQPTTALSRVLDWRPLRELGRLSYSWYLWHWPVLVFAEGLYGGGVGGHLSLPVRVGLLLFSLLLAEVSYRFVEDPVRHQRWLAARPWRGVALLGAVTAVSVALSLGWGSAVDHALRQPGQAEVAGARRDNPDLYARGCHDAFEQTVPTACVDSLGAGPTIALFGDSHAAHWAPALQSIASDRGWRLLYLTKSSCAPIDAPQWSEALGRAYDECAAWRRSALALLRDVEPDVTVVSGYHVQIQEIAEPALGPATSALFGGLASASRGVLVLRDIPLSETDGPQCLSRSLWRGRPVSACSFDYRSSEGEAVYEVQKAAAAALPNTAAVDLNDRICPDGRCEAMRNDSTVVWRDRHHITATFSRGMAAALEDEIDKVLSGPAPSANRAPSRRG